MVDNVDIYLGTIDDFMKEHPEIDPSLKPLIEPLFKEYSNQMFQFLLATFW